MVRIKIKDYTDTAFTKSDGILVQKELLKVLDKNEDISIDFEGIVYFTTLFFNLTLSYLVILLGIDEVKRRIQVVNLTEVGTSVYNISLENVKEVCSIEKKRKVV